jgi:hypothetical protein
MAIHEPGNQSPAAEIDDLRVVVAEGRPSRTATASTEGLASSTVTIGPP